MHGVRRFDHKIDLVGRNIDARQPVHDLIHLCEHDAVGEGRRLDDGRGFLGIRRQEQVALAIGLGRRDQRHARRQVDVIAGIEFVVGMDRPDRKFLGLHQVRDGVALRAGVAEVDLADHALLEELDMGRQRDAGHHEVDVVQVLSVERGKLVGEKVRLLLVVAFQAEDIAGLDDPLQHRRHVLRRDELATRKPADTIQTLRLVAATHANFCSCHEVLSLRTHGSSNAPRLRGTVATCNRPAPRPRR